MSASCFVKSYQNEIVAKTNFVTLSVTYYPDSEDTYGLQYLLVKIILDQGASRGIRAKTPSGCLVVSNGPRDYCR
jgi:hypothetical protein